MSEKSFISPTKHFIGYALPSNSIVLSLIAIFSALNFVMTYSIPTIAVPATGGYINFGDITVMYVALVFGPIIGGLAGGIGPMIADILIGAPQFAPGTLLIKGIEGFLIGLIANPKKNEERLTYYDILAVIIGGLMIPYGYFLYEVIVLGIGIPTASVEVPGNVFQFVVAAIVSTLLVTASRKNIIQGLPQVFEKVFVLENQ
ncbi:MAG: ECF transporter S component [Promethearchaeota archaeon]